jgi:hypothetical protein
MNEKLVLIDSGMSSDEADQALQEMHDRLDGLTLMFFRDMSGSDLVNFFGELGGRAAVVLLAYYRDHQAVG